MAQSKEELLNQPTITNQQSLVKALINNKREPKKLVIPGGSNMLENLDERNLEKAVYNWLRGCRHFSEVKINMTTGETTRKSDTYQAYEFPATRQGIYPWQRQDLGGKKGLAKEVVKILTTTVVLSIHVKKEGIFVTVPQNKKTTGKDLQGSADWEPHLLFTVVGKSDYQIY